MVRLQGLPQLIQPQQVLCLQGPHLRAQLPQGLCRREQCLQAIQQQSPLVYPARKADGITTLKDLAGRKAGVWPGHEDLELRWMLHRAGVPDAAVTRLPMPDTVAPFLAGETATGQMTCYHELHIVEETIPHDELVIFDGRASGTQILKDGLIAPAQLVAGAPEVVQAVVDAVLEGWTIAFDDPERAIAACLRARPERSHAEESAQLAAIRALSLTGAALPLACIAAR